MLDEYEELRQLYQGSGISCDVCPWMGRSQALCFAIQTEEGRTSLFAVIGRPTGWFMWSPRAQFNGLFRITENMDIAKLCERLIELWRDHPVLSDSLARKMRDRLKLERVDLWQWMEEGERLWRERQTARGWFALPDVDAQRIWDAFAEKTGWGDRT